MIQKTVQSIPKEVTVVAVTKIFPFKAVEEAYMGGLRHIGENRVEEAGGKIEEAGSKNMDGIVWHMVGHVQSRKVKDVSQMFDWVDSVDSVDLAQKLDAAASAAGKKLHVLLEVNLSGEETKNGFDLYEWEKNPDKLKYFHLSINRSMELKHIIVEGLMTMPPYVTNPEDNRSVFQSMKRLSSLIRAQIPSFGPQLSMGTSCDYEVAIEEGATQVRLGEALFGKRKKLNYE